MGRKSKASVRKKEIISHFHELVSQEGFAGASIARVANRMKVNPSLLIHYFGTKEQIVQEMVRDLFGNPSEKIFPGLAEQADPKLRFEQLLSYAFGTKLAGVINNRVFFECLTRGFRDPSIGILLEQFYINLRTLLLLEFTHAAEKDVIHVDDIPQAVDMLITLLSGKHLYTQLVSTENPDLIQEKAQLVKDSFTKFIGYPS